MGQVDIVAVNLDSGEMTAALYLVQRIAEVCPECGIIGVSGSTDSNAIIKAMRAGCGQFVHWPIEPQDLREAVDRLRRMTTPTAGGCQRICVVGSSGGMGATTVACNLALELAQVTQQRCALVDMNLQFGDVACAFDLSAKHSVADVCGSGVEIDRTLIEMALEELPCGVSVLARPERLEQAREVSADGVYELFRILEQMFPFIVADLPPYFGAATMATLDGADRVCLVTQLAVPFLRNALRMYDYLTGLGANEERIEVVLNRCKASHERLKVQDVEKQFARPVFAVLPNDYKRIGTSRDLGHPLMTDAPNGPARLAIHEMACKIASKQPNEPDVNPSSGGLLSFLRKPAVARSDQRSS